jgi:hypothetical protein
MVCTCPRAVARHAAGHRDREGHGAPRLGAGLRQGHGPQLRVPPPGRGQQPRQPVGDRRSSPRRSLRCAPRCSMRRWRAARSTGDVDLLQALLSEVLVREAQRPLRRRRRAGSTPGARSTTPSSSASRRATCMVNTTQLGVLLWPELAKVHGFAKSGERDRQRDQASAFNIMRETLAAGARVGPKRALDAVITEEVLRKAGGVDEDTAAFLMKVIADGMDRHRLGSSRELGRVAEGGASRRRSTPALRWGGGVRPLLGDVHPARRGARGAQAQRQQRDLAYAAAGGRAVDAQLLRLEHGAADGQARLRRADDQGHDRVHAVQRAGDGEALSRVPHRDRQQGSDRRREGRGAALPGRACSRRHHARGNARASLCDGRRGGGREAGRLVRR